MVTLERRWANYPDEKITKSYTAYLNNLNRPDIEAYNASMRDILRQPVLENITYYGHETKITGYGSAF